ncbi:sugar phosphate nucleotidyltransferase [Pseudonocardia hydrocarbonoxydans]|nr:NDP-sugar synthase [Pseudonocardia hydrocarbonoxydans]
MDDVEAVVLVGGKGTRLRPLTLSAPKPMLPTAGVPFLAHLLSRIRAAGVRHVVLGTSYLAETFSAHFGDGAALDLRLTYVVEDEPLGTGGGIRNVAAHLSAEHVLVFNGDVLAGTDLTAVVDTHRRTDADVTLHLVRVPDPRAFGCVPTDADGRVTAFLEKTPDPPTDQINAGCYVFRRSVIDSIPAGRAVSVERETFPGLLAAGRRVSGHVDSAYWRDMGTPADLVQGSADLVRGVAPSAALPGPTGDALVLDGARVDPSAKVSGGSTVGRGASVGAGASVEGSMLFDGAVVGAGAVVEHSVVGAGAVVEDGAVVVGSVVGDRAVVGSGCELRGGARVWPDAQVRGIRFSPDA